MFFILDKKRGVRASASTPTVTATIADNFTDTNGTLLTAHTIAPTNTPGASWSNITNSYNVQSNAAAPSVDAAENWSVVDTGLADGVFSVKVNNTNNTNYAGLPFRVTDANNWNVFQRGNSGAVIKAQLYKIVSGSATLLHESSIDWTDGSELGVIANGTSLKIYLNACLLATVTDGANSSATKVGLRASKNTHRFDNFFAGTLVNSPDGALRNVVFCGDSLTSGTVGDVQLTYPQQTLLACSTTPMRYGRGKNLGESGRRASGIEAAQGASANALYSSAFLKNICVVWIGTNDLGDGTSAATIEGYINTFCTNRRAAGFKVILCNVIARGDAGWTGAMETQRTTLNTNLASNYATYADAFVNLAGTLNDSTNTTYYQSDQLHLKTAGDTVVAGLVATAIAAV